jgi:hypothetical protein
VSPSMRYQSSGAMSAISIDVIRACGMRVRWVEWWALEAGCGRSKASDR